MKQKDTLANPKSLLCKGLTALKSIKLLYQEVNKTNEIIVLLKQKWQKRELPLTELEIKNAFAKINELTILVKLRSFQFRLLHASTVTNIHLKHYGIKSHRYCSFCEIHDETLRHLFFDCEVTQEIWEWFKTHVLEDVTFKSVLLSNMGVTILNVLSLIAKHYIYVSKCENKRPRIQGFKEYVKYYIKLEKEVAKMKDKQKVHEEKWKYINEFI